VCAEVTVESYSGMESPATGGTDMIRNMNVEYSVFARSTFFLCLSNIRHELNKHLLSLGWEREDGDGLAVP
jgi:hypothetical protein